jgi:cytosine/adenosine deaminase-related metal-dependent hydrolase
MGSAGMKLIWSPQSNVSLYGATANIPLALANNVTVALAPDWSMGGSQNLLDELRFADSWDNANFGNILDSKALLQMVTTHGAKALSLDTQLGSLAPGMLADISVFAGDTANPYDAILAAKPKNVRLVMVNGTVLYGDAVLQAAGPAAPGCEALDVCGTQKFLCAAETATTDKLNQTYVEISTAIGTALEAADAQTPDDGYNFAPIAPLTTCD